MFDLVPIFYPATVNSNKDRIWGNVFFLFLGNFSNLDGDTSVKNNCIVLNVRDEVLEELGISVIKAVYTKYIS